MRLFLASESPRRQILLKQLIEDFAVEAAGVEEIDSSADPLEVAVCNAALKARAVSLRHPEDWVLGADTVVILDGRSYGKPKDLQEAAEVLKKFSGRTHQVVTAISLQRSADDCKHDLVATTEVVFRNLTDEVIGEYLATVPVLDKAGAYGIQECGELLVESFSGELENVIGLPVAALKPLLESLKII